MAPFMAVHVRDSDIGGQGSMKATVFGIYKLADQEGVPELNAGALQRYLGEAVWLATVLLPGHGVTWTAVDDSSAIVTLTDGPWRVRCADHEERSGMLIPMSCAVAWLSPEGPQPYWRGRLTAIDYTFLELE